MWSKLTRSIGLRFPPAEDPAFAAHAELTDEAFVNPATATAQRRRVRGLWCCGLSEAGEKSSGREKRQKEREVSPSQCVYGRSMSLNVTRMKLNGGANMRPNFLSRSEGGVAA